MCCQTLECSSRTDGGAARPPVPAERRVRWRVPAPPAMRVARASAASSLPIIALIIACKADSRLAAALGCEGYHRQGFHFIVKSIFPDIHFNRRERCML